MMMAGTTAGVSLVSQVKSSFRVETSEFVNIISADLFKGHPDDLPFYSLYLPTGL